jgi:predicted nucleotidyltransferase
VHVNEEVERVLEASERDPAVVGVYLMGSRGAGVEAAASDWDVVVVLRGGESSHEKTATMDLVRTTLERMRKASVHELPAIAHARVLLDKTGEVAAALEHARRIQREELAELYDGYLNDFYRSMKAWRRRRELGARVQCGRSLWWLGEFLIGLSGERAPYPSAWAGRLGELEGLMLEVARTGDPRAQQELCRRVETVATAHGYRDVYDAWDGDIDHVLAFEFTL